MRTFGIISKLKKAWILSLTTVCPTSTQKREKLNRYPGVAQLGARVVWDHQAAGSIPVTRTKKAQESMFLSLFSIYEGWRKPSALALYDHPNKLEFVYLSNLQISTLKRYLLTHSPFSIGQQRFPLWEISTLCHWVLMFTIMTFFHNIFVTNQVYNTSCERKRSEWRLDLK